MEIMPTDKTDEIVKEFYDTMMLSYAKHTFSYNEIRKEISSENVILLPIFYQGKIVATSSFFIEKVDSKNNPYYGSVHRVTVDPNFRGLGFGTMANNNVLTYATQIGCNQIYCSVLLNIEGMGGGNKPNLAELNICINKLSYKPTGYRLVDLPDFSRVEDLQFTSTAVLWKPIGKEVEKNVYEKGLQELINYYNNPHNFEILSKDQDNELQIYPPKKTGATLASSANINDFIGTRFLPSYFLPFYGDSLKTVYFGFKYDKIRTRASEGNNIADINYQLLANQINNNLLVDLLVKIQERIVQNFETIYCDPKIKENNI